MEEVTGTVLAVLCIRVQRLVPEDSELFPIYCTGR